MVKIDRKNAVKKFVNPYCSFEHAVVINRQSLKSLKMRVT